MLQGVDSALENVSFIGHYLFIPSPSQRRSSPSWRKSQPVIRTNHLNSADTNEGTPGTLGHTPRQTCIVLSIPRLPLTHQELPASPTQKTNNLNAKNDQACNPIQHLLPCAASVCPYNQSFKQKQENDKKKSDYLLFKERFPMVHISGG